MDLAIKDKTAEYEKQQKQAEKDGDKNADSKKDNEDDDDFIDEDEREIMEKMKAEKLKTVQERQEEYIHQEKKKAQKENLWYGEYQEIVESEFLTYVTKAKFSVVHFYHKDFERCKIIDFHLRKIAPEHTECKFMRLDAEKSPFFVNKLAIKMLPTVCCFKNGVLQDQIVGFGELGAKDDFKTMDLIRR
jgi:hypothetical protein